MWSWVLGSRPLSDNRAHFHSRRSAGCATCLAAAVVSDPRGHGRGSTSAWPRRSVSLVTCCSAGSRQLLAHFSLSTASVEMGRSLVYGDTSLVGPLRSSPGPRRLPREGRDGIATHRGHGGRDPTLHRESGEQRADRPPLNTREKMLNDRSRPWF